MNDLSIERMYELEKMAIDSNIIFPLTLKEWRYLERAEKMSLKDIKELIDYFKKHFIIINQIKFMNDLLNRFNCNEIELEQRYKDVHKIIRYENLINNKLLKEQKRMIKRMKNY